MARALVLAAALLFSVGASDAFAATSKPSRFAAHSTRACSGFTRVATPAALAPQPLLLQARAARPLNRRAFSPPSRRQPDLQPVFAIAAMTHGSRYGDQMRRRALPSMRKRRTRASQR